MQPSSTLRSRLGAFSVIAVVLGGTTAAFAYTAGWISPDRLSREKVVAGLSPPEGPAPGHRRNHVKGICFTGTFEANGAGAALSRASLLAVGSYPVIGRFNLATAAISDPDAKPRVRGLSLQILGTDGSEWRTAMITAPFFPVSTPEAFYALQQASASKEPGAMGAFAATHPEIVRLGAWAKSAPWTASYAEERYNSLNAFIFTSTDGQNRAVRWSMQPEAQPVAVSPDQLATRAPDFLEQDIKARVAAGPVRWTMVVTIAGPDDPVADPSKAWPEGRRTVEVGTLTAREVEDEADGPCRDVNYDPTVLPDGMSTSADPFPAARSSAYALSYQRRAAEAAQYPRTTPGARP
ncbi:catalase [Pseudoroseomonas wenyumeiae]|uniref:Catalase-related peroxidase n=1 Tax=Teichococcus wenyumeiae TaxID=2478470 RepID=A0A3A9JG66_9PROT|nr:catalase family peroxidase [Pseudoroseomonas wenyumeiae]RKK02554.1 catalase family peroxidase [Pseudoroseomonas wenyumeiae]RMI15341.1 catalase [Pseudoroseomonas wenyumeiae]